MLSLESSLVMPAIPAEMLKNLVEKVLQGEMKCTLEATALHLEK